MQDLQPIHIQKYYNKKLQEGASGNTVKHHHANVHRALEYALKQNWIPYNPASRVELPKLKKFTGNFYTDEQIKKLLMLVKDTNVETPVLLAAAYGLRRSEVIGLKWNAVDFKNETITIQHTVVGNGKNMFSTDSTKSKSSTRTLPLLSTIKEHLARVKARQDTMKKLLGKGFIDNGYICIWDDGKLIRPEYLSRKFKTVLTSSNLPIIRFHDLRHSSASLLIANGFSLKEIAEWLGHSSISTTNMYAHLQYKSTIKMADKVGERLFSAS